MFWYLESPADTIINITGRIGERGDVGGYNSAGLYSRNFLTQHNAEAMHSHLLGLLNRLISHREQMAGLQEQLEGERGQLIELRQRQTEVEAK